MIVVADTSPINYLVRIECIEVLYSLYQHVYLPTAVLRELQQPRTPSVVRDWTENLPAWTTVYEPRPITRGELDGLDPGECAAIETALELHADILLIDEVKGRRVATERLGIDVRGVLGVIQDAHIRGLIDGRAAFNRLLTETRFYLGPDLQRMFTVWLDSHND